MTLLSMGNVKGGIQVRNPAEEIKKTLKEADKNGDGRLSKNELEYAFRQLGAYVPGWRAYRGLCRFDNNQDNVISGDELDDLVEYALNKKVTSDGKRVMSMEEFKRWLQRFDGNGDGRISQSELREAVRLSRGLFASWKSKKSIKSCIDANHNGFIDDHEFRNLAQFAENYLNIKIINF
ncbi:polcalcin Phl p 7-like [Senna tora]|uniref:Polcalcin Phl p 7-like n=1 Tax=Senna tora TaxID=362788 RepID=A0A834TXY5_9FABA|nr:polcalcin Phl p 7-like [Senna tora]